MNGGYFRHPYLISYEKKNKEEFSNEDKDFEECRQYDDKRIKNRDGHNHF